MAWLKKRRKASVQYAIEIGFLNFESWCNISLHNTVTLKVANILETFLRPSSRTSPRQQGDPTRQRDVLETVRCPFSDGGRASRRTAGELGNSQDGTRRQAAVQAGTWVGLTFLPSGLDAGATLPSRCWYALPKKKLNNDFLSCCFKKKILLSIILLPIYWI